MAILKTTETVSTSDGNPSGDITVDTVNKNYQHHTVIVALPYQNQPVQCYSRAPYNSLRTRTRSEDGEAEIDAALTLLDLANGISCMMKHCVNPYKRNHEVNPKPGIEELTSLLFGSKGDFDKKVKHENSKFPYLEDFPAEKKKKRKIRGKFPFQKSSSPFQRVRLNVGFDDFRCRHHNMINEPTLEKQRLQEVQGVSFDGLKTDQLFSSKKIVTLITPTFHTGFQFSIIHLLSATRVAMVTPREVQKVDRDSFILKEEKNLHSLTVDEIVQRVRSNPFDPSILKTQEPLYDLVRGVLKIFSSKTAPLVSKTWKPLALYEKSSKTWQWIGPTSLSSSSSNMMSSEAWNLPNRMLVRLVDSFAKWLKNRQEALEQIGRLPSPPGTLTKPTNVDENERFRILRAQRSISTINPSSGEIRTYFHKEEALRYSIPERAFSYTAIDGQKSTVAPLRRCSGKPSSKARDHFMLKPDRPAYVTVLCLVRDAAARLPSSIGTRADICTLVRDSQYITEDISDVQINQVVSKALDRLHYEIDPCVHFNVDRRAWIYLHRDRREEDFESDGTSSTKKQRRSKENASQ